MTNPETREKRITRERHEMDLRVWQFSPSEISDEPNPYPPGTAGHAAWAQAAQWRAEIRAREPGYFDNA